MRTNIFRVLLLICCISPSRLGADGTIQMTGANMDMPSGTLVLRGSPYDGRGFTFSGFVSSTRANWGPSTCNGDPLHCKPGDALSLHMNVGGSELTGPATLDGVTYTDLGHFNSPNGMNVSFDGSLTLPPMGPPVTLTAPFIFTGVFIHAPDNATPPTRENFTGQGTAIVSLEEYQAFPGSWRITHVRYTLSKLPAPWQSVEVGDFGTPGYAFQGPDGDLFMAGAGSDIWGTEDSFRFVYQQLDSDGEISALVGQQTNGDSFAKTGVMLRQSVNADAPHVILDVKPDGGVEFMTRSTRGGDTRFLAGDVVHVTPVGGGAAVSMYATLTLTRSGNSVTGSVCSQSVCRVVGTTSWMAGAALVGVAVTSHDPSMLNNAYFPANMPTVEKSSLPPPWHLTNVGDVGLPGQASMTSGVFTVSGAGADIWGTEDSFAAVTQPGGSDVTIVARVVDEQDTHTFAKAGVMIGGLSPSSARVILDVKPDGGIEFMVRQADGLPMSFRGGAGAAFPVWLRLVRAATSIEGSFSTDGQSWMLVGASGANLGSAPEIGLAVTSHDRDVLNTAHFDNVSVAASGALQNFLTNPGFEESTIPTLGPGWVSDDFRQSAAQTETAQPAAGRQNAACRTAESLDCGIYQEFTLSAGGNYTFSIQAASDKEGAFVGVNVNGAGYNAAAVNVGGYQAYNVGFFAHAGDVIRVWAYSPAAPGALVIDEASVTVDTGPR